MAEISSLIAPRSHFSTVGIYDELTPMRGVEKIEKVLTKVYSDMNSRDEFKLKTYSCGHLETREMRDDILAFIKEKLCSRLIFE